MTEDPNLPDQDDDEVFCEGDPHPDDINWSKVAKLEAAQAEALAISEDDRPMAMLGLLGEMYGDDLQVI